jgi:hypothetical protein
MDFSDDCTVGLSAAQTEAPRDVGPVGDTSSSPAANSPVVGATATAFAASSFEPIFRKSIAAAVISSGAAIKMDTSVLLPRHRPQAG